jgi:hypothetical protein
MDSLAHTTIVDSRIDTKNYVTVDSEIDNENKNSVAAHLEINIDGGVVSDFVFLFFCWVFTPSVG